MEDKILYFMWGDVTGVIWWCIVCGVISQGLYGGVLYVGVMSRELYGGVLYVGVMSQELYGGVLYVG